MPMVIIASQNVPFDVIIRIMSGSQQNQVFEAVVAADVVRKVCTSSRSMGSAIPIP